ncbi:MAG: chemotaxis protein CheD [Candidatus Omnitrophica bacterium]|nr:chemotaxis protein CheD [Candidatus Omnitrophota bacterium]
MALEKIIEENVIEVPMAGMVVSQAPHILVTKGLGSCLGITIYDPLKKIGGMAHPMLPDINKARVKSNPSRFVNSAITLLLEELDKRGCSRMRLVVKIFGGAHMFSFINTDSNLNVGQKNIEMAQTIFRELNLKIISQEVGGTFGRTIYLNLEDGKVLVKTVSWGEKEV